MATFNVLNRTRLLVTGVGIVELFRLSFGPLLRKMFRNYNKLYSIWFVRSQFYYIR